MNRMWTDPFPKIAWHRLQGATSSSIIIIHDWILQEAEVSGMDRDRVTSPPIVG